MTNYEKHKSEIERIILEGENFGLVNNKVVACNGNYCSHCEFHTPMPLISCAGKRKEWLNAEHKEHEIDWTKVPKGTHVWVRDRMDASWTPYIFVRYIAHDKQPFMCTTCDLWVVEKENEKRVYKFVGCGWKYCKLDDSVDPTPFYKNLER